MPHLLNIWPTVSRQLAGSPRVLLLFDYDGTLTPIVARPEIATLSDEMRRSLSVLAAMDRFVVGVVSGRGLADLEALVAIPGLVYAGNHGLEMRGGGMDFLHPEALAFEASLAEVARLLERALAEVPGILVDNKRLTLSVHFRSTPDSYSAQVNATVLTTAAPFVEAGQMKITRGKKLLEVRPNLDWGKGKAIEKIREDCGDSPLTMFFGDDATDEDGFAVVQNAGGLAVFIGPPRHGTIALHQLDTPAEVGQVLALLARLDQPAESTGTGV
ncbi:MAG: trehalose-phosphatase [Chloroflexi bacterium]|nr:trehalose-phosphatase [Chloroflexota bacterium]MCI0789615.1 trehalose-phosphatase [Chloroflexota bacterium]MCI0801426.1 trehalose-phosphatase [Chloroflexota bacterium]MCI0811150.1 trehalose-phosphatase [Chloroflexota bacterium]MCI0829416.1 trehalose-phosphatase [Chloroflexota bacterium]